MKCNLSFLSFSSGLPISEFWLSLRKLYSFFYILLSIITILSCESNKSFYRPDLPEQLCTVGIIDADDTLNRNSQNSYSFYDYFRYISFEKSFQSEYSGEVNDSLRDLSFSISSSEAELFSYQNDSTLKRLESFKLPVSLQFASGEKYILEAGAEGLQDISAETIVPGPPGDLILNSIHKETEPAIPPPGCSWPLDNHDSVKYAVIDISFDVTKDSYYAILVEGIGMDYGLMLNSALGYVDFLVRNNNVRGFNAIIYGQKCPIANVKVNKSGQDISPPCALFLSIAIIFRGTDAICLCQLNLMTSTLFLFFLHPSGLSCYLFQGIFIFSKKTFILTKK